MVIKENSNVVTLRLITMYLKDREKYLEDMWEKTSHDEKLHDDHCIIIGRLNENREMLNYVSQLNEVNEWEKN